MTRYLLLLFWSLLLFIPESIGQDSLQVLENELKNNPEAIKEAEIREKLWEAFIDLDIEKAMEQAQGIVTVGKKTASDSILSLGYQRLGTTYAYLNQFDSSGHYFRKALVLYNQMDNIEGIASTQRNLGQDFNMLGELDSASYYYARAGENYALINDSVGMADIYNSEAIVYYIKGFYNLAFDKAVQGEKIFEQYTGRDPELNQNRMVIAAIYAAMKDTTHAITYYRKVLDYFKANDLVRQYVANGILLSELLIPNPAALSELNVFIPELVRLSGNLQDVSLTNNVQLASAEFAYRQGDYSKAQSIQNELINNSQGDGQEYLLAENSLALGKTLLALGDFPGSIEKLKASIRLFTQLGMESLTRDAQQFLSQAYEALGDYENSLTAFKAFKEIDETIYTEERTNRFSELQTIYETEKKALKLSLQEEEIKSLYAQAEADRFVKILYATGMVSVILISGLLFFGFRQRIKRKQAARKQQEVIYQNEIAFKKKELASQTLHLIQKHNFIEELKENLETLKVNPDQVSSEIKRIERMLSQQTTEDEKWETFKNYFSEVHNNFDQQLKAVAADISENDIRLASFLRMNMTTKEISSMLNVQPESVMKSKYRLKKKLGLGKEQDLNVFLETLTEQAVLS